MPDFGTPFSGVNLNKKLNDEELLRAIRFMTAAEFEAVQLYQQVAAATSNKDAKKVLESIIDEEIVHAGEFMKLIKTLSPEEEKLYKEGEDEAEELMEKAYVKAARAIKVLQVSQVLDKIAGEIEQQDPAMALSIDKLSDVIENSIK